MARKIHSHNSKILKNTIRTIEEDDTDNGSDSDSSMDISDEEYETADSDIDSTADTEDNTTQEGIERTCNCRKKDRSNCPLKGNCLVCCLVYKATVTRVDNCHCETYTGVTAGTFKCRWYGHCHDIRHRPKPGDENKGTTLSNYIWKLKDQNLQYNLEWQVVMRGADYNPATGICGVCNLEKFFIMFKVDGASLNQRSEFFTHCRHYRKFLLCPPPKEKKKRDKAPNR